MIGTIDQFPIAVNNLSSLSEITTNPTFILIDGHSLAFRSFFAFAKGRDGGLRTKTGIPTSICFGFLKCLLELITTENPQAIAIAFDLGEPTFRHEADENYKAGRAETPEDFIPDLANLQELLQVLNLPIITVPGYEADDILGSLAQQASAAGYQVKIFSGDRDLLQLIDAEKRISVLNFSPHAWKSSNYSITEFNSEKVLEKFGILPTQVVDFKSLCGDKSDNIPGVKGIGEKTALELLTTYKNLDNIYQQLDKIKPAVQKKLIAGKEDAYKSRYLATIVVDVPLEINLADCELKGFDNNAIIPIFEKLEFKKFIEQIQDIQRKFNGEINDEVVENVITAKIEDVDNNEDTWFWSAEETRNFKKSERLNSPINPNIINTEEKLIELVALLQTLTNPKKPTAWDTETTDLEPRNAELVGIGCCWGKKPEDVAYIPVGHKMGGNLSKDLVLTKLRPILESAEYPKVLQNAKFDRLIFKCQGINLNGVVLDTMLASYVINPDHSHNLTDLGMRELGLTAKSYTDLVPKGKTIADIDIISVADYCGMDVYTTYGLVEKLQSKLQKTPELYKLLLEVEQPLEAVLAEMEYTGVRINSDYLKELSQQLEIDLAKLEDTAISLAGEKFNLGSPKQLSYILFDKLGLSTKYSRKIQSGFSTDAATLEKLQEVDNTGFVNAIIEYRTLAKLKSTYVDALPALVHPVSHRLHTDFNQTATSTGRLSSSHPNLQNIPIKTAFSRQIRKAFLPESNWLMIAADYSQIELRILAHLSQEPVLISAYQQNEDIHKVTARLVFEKEEVTAEERRFAKTINFGVIYGMGAQKFARETGIEQKEAKLFIERFNQRYAKVFEYLEKVKKQAISQGYVETILGRRRYFEFTNNKLRELKGRDIDDIDLSSLKNLGVYDAGLLRAAANAPIQGSSADIIKVAMVQLAKVLQQYQARLLLQVHDELVLEVPKNECEELQVQIKSVMENAVSLSVPLVVDVRAGDNWMETK
ncbi:DNA polymerase I [Anabaena sp. FACHB-1237]|uniref:DNA polymerase I n=1 Tax=Anabaena sp. FACHB-1237 TaxID=2692769 RepID=UPI001680491E|nr:DNA polymerase I [Anabaena sp. FACHB-1237]MBD2136524.1 DNA polymerase I [Anabaena sp. FACHB-1237]